MIGRAVDEAHAELERVKTQAVRGDDPLAALLMIIGVHTSRQLGTLLEPRHEQGRLIIEVPVALGPAMSRIGVFGAWTVVVVPAWQKHMQLTQTAEAWTELTKLFDATSRLEGEAGITPPLAVNCNDGPDGRCVPSRSGAGPGAYDIALWTNNPVWTSLDYVQDQAHTFHYNFIWANVPAGPINCMFTVQAFADLDDDGVFSTFERSGSGVSGNRDGVRPALGMYINHEFE